MTIQVETIFTYDDNGYLRGINEPTGEIQPAPRFFFGQTQEGSICRFRYDLPEAVIEQLTEAAAAEPKAKDLQYPTCLNRFKDILQAHAPIEKIWAGPAYRFPDHIETPTGITQITDENADLLKGDFAEDVSELDKAQPYIAAIEAAQAVSVCQSVRISATAHEAGIDTLEAYRRRGFATAAVAGWALAVRALGLVPLYSTSWDNLASQGVAKRLGLMQYGVDLHFT